MARRLEIEDDETGPERTCIVTRQPGPTASLLRFVASPDGVVTPDVRARLPGRGVWVGGRRSLVEIAVRKGLFARGLRAPVKVSDDLPEMIDRLLAEDARQSLSLANKAGLVTVGFAKVEAAIFGGKAVALISANDGSPEGRRKLRQAVRRAYDGSEALPLVACLSGREMDLALGRENAIHAALLAGPGSDAFLNRCARLDRYRQPDAVESSVTPVGDAPDGADPEVAAGD